ncbi:hypothetical protein EDC44_1124 [Cricetibacter osteomyelitidis]|uniref:DUF3413 domain-containing protein n=1 Tax=Cricetibacter osteomyelitidis TaxID=1521931 RepID=A0A4R2SZH4_9PAST|nr:DUF3413 domain-containing protein [Cricetibacter osteomyelitidis]TCP94945.1 hypothetical protein EDC44_1124 [Cricetibacter osteomyelitidis]
MNIKEFKQKFNRQYREETSQKISWGHWFAFFNILWAIIIGARYAFIIDWPDTLFGKLYFFISLLGHFSFVVFALYLLVIFPLSFIVKNHRTFRGLSVIFATIGITLLLVDTEVFTRFNLHLSSLVWNLLVNPDNGDLSRTWQIFFAPMPIILLAQMLYSRWSWEKLRSLNRQKWSKYVVWGFGCAFIATHLIYSWADAFIYRPITMQKSNFPLSYPMTARTFLEKNGILDKAEYNKTLDEQGRPEAPKIIYPKKDLQFAQADAYPNIILITISGLRYDAVTPQKMPNLTAFADTSAQFINHYSTGNNNNTGLTGLFYGLSANYLDSLLQYQKTPVLINRLQQTSYKFGLFSSTNFKDSLYRQGIFHHRKLTKQTESNQKTTANFVADLIKMKEQNEPFFEFLSLNLRGGLSELQYNVELAEIDRLLGQVIAQLPKQNTITIITTEHGYAFGKTEKELRNYFAPEETHVPFIVHWDQLKSKQYDKITGHADLVPTLMETVFKVKNPAIDYAQGENLLNPNRHVDWVLTSNYRWNVIVTEGGVQYHIDRQGNYQKYDRTYEKVSSNQPPLGLFLDVFKRTNSFVDK